MGAVSDAEAATAMVTTGSLIVTRLWVCSVLQRAIQGFLDDLLKVSAAVQRQLLQPTNHVGGKGQVESPGQACGIEAKSRIRFTLGLASVVLVQLIDV